MHASGLGPEAVAATSPAKKREGYTAFKFEVGFGPARDIANFEAIRATVGPEAIVMVGANQAWSPEAAGERVDELAPLDPYCVQETMPADEPAHQRQALTRRCDVPLAAGGWPLFVQLDGAKCGGV